MREDVHRRALANVRKSQDKVRKRKEDGGQEDNFKVGELVLQKNRRQEQRKGGKLEADFLGPLKIVALEGKSADLVSQRGKQKMKVNIDHLTHYVQPEERVPAKLRKVLVSSPLDGPSHTQQTHTNSTHAPTPSGTPGCQKAPGPAKDTEHLISDIWAGGRQETLWSRVGPYKVFSETLKHLAPGKELETEIVNAYLLLVCMRTRTKMIDSFAMSDIWQGSQKQYKRLDLVNHDVAAGAVCHQGHWTLVIMYMKENRALFVDPFGATKQQVDHCRDITRALVRKHCPAIGRWSCTTLDHPKQLDSTSCGVFVCKLAEQILQGDIISYAVDQQGVNSIRLEMATALLTNTDDLSDLCRACGEESSGADVDDWVRR